MTSLVRLWLAFLVCVLGVVLTSGVYAWITPMIPSEHPRTAMVACVTVLAGVPFSIVMTGVSVHHVLLPPHVRVPRRRLQRFL